MKRRYLYFTVLALLLWGLTGCYTQLQVVDRSNEAQNYGYYQTPDNGNDEYYEGDSLVYYDDYTDPEVNIYLGSPYYDPYWDSPWMWNRWGYYSGFYYNDYDYYYWNTPGYWFRRHMYPFVAAYPAWGYNNYYYGWDPYYYGYGYGHSHYYSHTKRPFNRRGEDTRRIVRSSGGDRQVSNGTMDNRRYIRRSDANTNGKRSTISNGRKLNRKSAIRSTDRDKRTRTTPKFRSARQQDRDSKSHKRYRSTRSKSSRDSDSRSYRPSSSRRSSSPSYRGSSRSSGSSSRSSSSSGSSSRSSSSSSSSSSRSSKRR